jgi:inosine-uridine nucleoside N-ribohydrolase
MCSLRCLLLLLGLLVLPLAAQAKIPVVFDTDIGTDVDDTWALAQLLRSPELDVRLILTGTEDTRYRAELTAKFLEVTGYTHIPIGIGERQPMEPERRTQAPWLKRYDLTAYPGVIHEDGIGAFIDLVMRSEETVTVIAVGPVPNLARALEREPRIAAKCRFIGMHGSVDVGYGGARGPAAEYNVVADVAAFRAVLAAPWQEIVLTPLDTCGLVHLRGYKYRAIWTAMDDPMLRAVIENYCLFAPRAPWWHFDQFAVASSTLFDCVAVYLAYAEELLEFESVRFTVTDDGFTRRDPRGPFEARMAMTWRNLAAFEDHLVDRLHHRHR